MSEEDEDLEVSFEGQECVYKSKDGKKFYNQCFLPSKNLDVVVGDIVKVRLDEDMPAVCQVLAVFEDTTADEASIEVRWFLERSEVPMLRKKRKLFMSSNEIVESETVDDIPVGSVLGHVLLTSEEDDVGALSCSAGANSTADAGNEYLVRFLYSADTSALIEVSSATMLQRGFRYSGYAAAYPKLAAAATAHEGGSASSCTGLGGRVRFTVDDMLAVDSETAGYRGSGSSSSISDSCSGSSSSSGTNASGPFTVIQKRAHLTTAIRRLHLAVLPKRLPCREKETEHILRTLREVLRSGLNSFPFYISGLPGTGKTATVLSCIDALNEDVNQGTLPPFEFLEINCLRLHAPGDAYTVLWKHLSPDGQSASASVARKKLVRFFEESASRVVPSSSAAAVPDQRPMTVLLIDEIDYLATRDQRVMYDFCNWPIKNNSRLFVIGVANTMDLLEQQMSRHMSRNPVAKHLRIVFTPYDHTQMDSILTDRLGEFVNHLLDKATIEFTARKAANAGGDVRRALRICQRMLEFVRDSLVDAPAGSPSSAALAVGTSKKDEILFVNQACNEYLENPLIVSMRRACMLDKTVLTALYRHATSASVLQGEVLFITGLELFLRLGDLVTEMRNRAHAARNEAAAAPNDNSGRLRFVPRTLILFPPWNVFRESVDRLISQGLIKLSHMEAHGLVGAAESGAPTDLLQCAAIQLDVDPADVKTAFRTTDFAVLVDRK